METLSYLAPLFQLDVIWTIALGTLGGLIIGALPGLTATMGVALLIPLTFGMALIPVFSKILMVPRRLLTMAIVIFCFIGLFSINLNPVDLYTMVGFGVLGWGRQKFGFSQAALCIALILGPTMEANLRRGMLQAGDNVIEFLSGPITLLFLALTALSLFWPMIARHIGARNGAPTETME